MRIDGVPDHLTRADYDRLIASVGFDTRKLVELRFAPEGVYAELFATDVASGQILVDQRKKLPATHVVYIPVYDS